MVPDRCTRKKYNPGLNERNWVGFSNRDPLAAFFVISRYLASLRFSLCFLNHTLIVFPSRTEVKFIPGVGGSREFAGFSKTFQCAVHSLFSRDTKHLSTDQTAPEPP